MVHPVLQSLGNAERGTGVPVVLLTGVDRLSLDAVAFSLADSCPSVCSITYDVRPNAAVESGLDIVRMVTRPHVNGLAFGETDSFGLEECCMSCTVKHDVGRVLESMCSALLSGPSELPESSGFSESGSAEVGESLSPAGTGEFGVLAGVGVGKESTSGNSGGNRRILQMPQAWRMQRTRRMRRTQRDTACAEDAANAGRVSKARRRVL